MNYFLGISIPADIQRALYAVVEPMKDRWPLVSPKKYHVTVRFLGKSISSHTRALYQLSHLLQGWRQGLPTMVIGGSLGSFRGSVVYAPVAGFLPIEQVVNQAFGTPNARQTPHMTLVKGKQMAGWESLWTPRYDLPVPCISLFQSGQGGEYAEIDRYVFAA